MQNNRRNRNIGLGSARVKVDKFRRTTKNKAHNINYNVKEHSVTGHLQGYVKELHYNPARASPIFNLNPAARNVLFVENIKLTSTKRESDVRQFMQKTDFLSLSEIRGGLFMTPQFNKHSKDIKGYLVPARRFGGVSDTPLYVPEMRQTNDAEMLDILKRHNAGNLHNRTLQDVGVPTDDANKQQDVLLTDQDTLDANNQASATGGQSQADFTRLEELIEQEIQEEEEKLDDLELSAEQRLVSQWSEIIQIDSTFRVILSLIPNPTSSNQIATRNLLEEQLNYSRTVEIAGLPSGERLKLQHNLKSMESKLRRGQGGNNKYRTWILASLEITDRQIKTIMERDGHAVLDDRTPVEERKDDTGDQEEEQVEEESNLN